MISLRTGFLWVDFKQFSRKAGGLFICLWIILKEQSLIRPLRAERWSSPKTWYLPFQQIPLQFHGSRPQSFIKLAQKNHLKDQSDSKANVPWTPQLQWSEQFQASYTQLKVSTLLFNVKSTFESIKLAHRKIMDSYFWQHQNRCDIKSLQNAWQANHEWVHHLHWRIFQWHLSLLSKRDFYQSNRLISRTG